MGGYSRRVWGTTLVELLVAATFLGICASVILNTIGSSGSRAGYAKRRAAIYALLIDQIDQVRTTGRTTTPTTGTSSSYVYVPNVPVRITVSRTISLISGYTNLFDVKASATWMEGSRSDTMSTETLVRSPDV